MTNIKKWITASQAAELAGVTSETIRNLCKSGALSYKKRNHLFYVNSEDVMQRAEQYAEIHEATINTEQFLKEAQALRDNAHAELKAVKEKTREIRLEHGYSVSNISALSYFAHSVLSVLGEKYAQEFTERELDIIKNYLATGTVYDPQSMVTRTRAHMLFMRFFRKLVHVKNDLRTKDDTIVKMGENLELLNGIIKKQQEQISVLTLAVKQGIRNDEVDKIAELDYTLLHTHKSLQVKLVDLDLSVRAISGLKSAGIQTLEDLIKTRRGDLLKIRNFGKKSLTELDELLEKKGLTWSMTYENILAYTIAKLRANE